VKLIIDVIHNERAVTVRSNPQCLFPSFQELQHEMYLAIWTFFFLL